MCSFIYVYNMYIYVYIHTHHTHKTMPNKVITNKVARFFRRMKIIIINNFS